MNCVVGVGVGVRRLGSILSCRGVVGGGCVYVCARVCQRCLVEKKGSLDSLFPTGTE